MTVLKTKSVFDSVHTVARYLYFVQPDLSPIKLHKGLYFLFAYYGASNAKENEFPLLFDAKFEAWKYGPVVREVFNERNDDKYFSEELVREAVKEVESVGDIKTFIDELISDIYSYSDLTLVFRSKQDTTWENAVKSEDRLINTFRLVQEYKEKYL